MKILMTVASLLMAFGSTAYAQRGGGQGVHLGLGLSMGSNKTTVSVSGVEAESESSETITDLDLGYKWASGLYLGFAYAGSGGKSGDDNNSSAMMGLGLGYISGAFFARLGYYLTGTLKDGDNSWSEGSGIGFDIGYLFPVTSSFSLGGSLAHRGLEFKKLEDGGVERENSSLKLTAMSPRLLLAFSF